MSRPAPRRFVPAVLLAAVLLAACGAVASRPAPTPLRVAAGQAVDSVLSLGQPVDVRGRVAEDIHVLGADATIEAGAVVGGNVGVIGGALTVEPGARIDGFVFDLNALPFHLDEVLTLASFWAAWALFRLVAATAVLAAALLLTAIWPRWIAVVGERIRATPWGAARVGLWSGVLLVLAGAALALTVVGLPVAAGLGLVFAAGIVVGLAGLGYALGDAIASRLDADWPGGVRSVALGLGLVLGFSFVPLLGPLLLGVALLVALGAAVSVLHAWVRRS